MADVPVSNSILSDILLVTGGFDLLGSLIGPAVYCEASLQKRINKVQEILYRLSDLQDSQMETTFLRSCLALLKIAYVLRTCPPGIISRALGAFDGLMREALSDLAGSPLPDWAWLKASLPSSLGGLNICKASLHAPAACISSFHQVQPLILGILDRSPMAPPHLPSAIFALAQAAARPEWGSIQDINVRVIQHCLSHAVDEAQYAALLADAPDSRARALALSLAILHAGDWLNVVPSTALGLHLQDRETPLQALGSSWVSPWGSPLWRPSSTFFRDVLSPSGEAMQPSGFVIAPFIYLQSMVLYDYFLF